MPSIRPSKYPSSSRASCSSSTRTARNSMLRRHAFGQPQLGNLHAGAGPLAGGAGQLQLIVGAVDSAEPLVHVAQADAAAQRVLQAFFSHPQTVVMHFDDGVAVAQ